MIQQTPIRSLAASRYSIEPSAGDAILERECEMKVLKEVRPLVPVLVLVVSLGLVACAGGQAKGMDDNALRPIEVADVQVEMGVGSPIPVHIQVSGTWPDLCAQLAKVEMTSQDRQIDVVLLASPAVDNCPPDFVGVPFGLTLPVNAVELADGEYAVSVNGVGASFDWPPD